MSEDIVTFTFTHSRCVVCCGGRQTLSYGTIAGDGSALLLAYGTYYIYIGINIKSGTFLLTRCQRPNGTFLGRIK